MLPRVVPRHDLGRIDGERRLGCTIGETAGLIKGGDAVRIDLRADVRHGALGVGCAHGIDDVVAQCTVRFIPADAGTHEFAFRPQRRAVAYRDHERIASRVCTLRR